MNTETTELPQTSFEEEHKITAGAPMTRNEVSQETPEQTKERIDRDIKAGRRSPEPASVDQTKSSVTPEQRDKVEDAAWQPARSTAPEDPKTDEDAGKKGGKSSGHASEHPQHHKKG